MPKNYHPIAQDGESDASLMLGRLLLFLLGVALLVALLLPWMAR